VLCRPDQKMPKAALREAPTLFAPLPPEPTQRRREPLEWPRSMGLNRRLWPWHRPVGLASGLRRLGDEAERASPPRLAQRTNRWMTLPVVSGTERAPKGAAVVRKELRGGTRLNPERTELRQRGPWCLPVQGKAPTERSRGSQQQRVKAGAAA